MPSPAAANLSRARPTSFAASTQRRTTCASSGAVTTASLTGLCSTCRGSPTQRQIAVGSLAWSRAIGIAVIVPCDHSFGWEAPVIHLGRGFFLTHDKMFMIEGVVLNSPSAMQDPVTASLPSPCSPQRNRRSPVPPSGLLLFWLNGT
jgi:hypothetical protein